MLIFYLFFVLLDFIFLQSFLCVFLNATSVFCNVSMAVNNLPFLLIFVTDRICRIRAMGQENLFII